MVRGYGEKTKIVEGEMNKKKEKKNKASIEQTYFTWKQLGGR